MAGFTASHQQYPRAQCGATLIVGLIMLLVLTLLGVAAMSNVSLQEKMAGGLMDRHHAFQAAEMALREAETRLAKPPLPSGDGVFDITVGDGQPNPYDLSVWSSNYIEAAPIDGMDQAPRYRIERASDSTPTMYRLTAIGYGRRGTSIVVLQSTLAVY